LFFQRRLEFDKDLSKDEKESQRNPLKSRVLVLNQSYEPISICSAKKALLLLLTTKAELVEKKDGFVLHSVRSDFPLPSIIRLSRFINIPRKRIELSRKNILRRDGYRCQYCGTYSTNL